MPSTGTTLKSVTRALPQIKRNTSTPFMFRLTRAFLKPSQIQHYVGDTRGFYVQRYPYHSLFVNPPTQEVPEMTITELIEKFATDIGQAKEYSIDGLRQTEEKRRALMELIPKPEDELPPRKMEDSFVSAIVPLKEKSEIRERYVSYRGHVRIGRLLEDLDVFAVYCAFKHILNPRSIGKSNPYSVVTALVDSIHIAKDILKSDEDIRISGHVTYAGRSSIEVCMIVDQVDDNGVYQKAFDAVFLMVARDPMNKGSARINPLKADTPEEQEFMKNGQSRQQTRKQQEEEHILKKPPNAEESALIHQHFLERTRNDPGVVLKEYNRRRMSDTILKTVIMCQPQYRNRYNKVFGGFIMRQALELAYANVLIHAGCRPRLVHVDDIKFKLPVEIGDILQYRSYIGYVKGNFIHTVVVAEIMDVNSKEGKMSNTFHFDFYVPEEEQKEPIREIEFESYQEAIQFINSRRHFRKLITELGHKLTDKKIPEDF